MSDRLGRISENAGRIYAALQTQGDPSDTAPEWCVRLAVAIEAEVMRQDRETWEKAIKYSTGDPGDER